MITLRSTRKGSKTTDYSIFQTFYNQFLNDHSYSTSLQALVLAIIVFTALYNLTNLTCLVFLYLWSPTMASRVCECCSSRVGATSGVSDICRVCLKRKAQPTRTSHRGLASNLNRRKQFSIKNTPPLKRLIRCRRFPSLHFGYPADYNQLSDPLSHCSSEPLRALGNTNQPPSPLCAYRTEKPRHNRLSDPLSHCPSESLRALGDTNQPPSPLCAYRTEKPHYPAFNNDTIRTPSKTQKHWRDSEHSKNSGHSKDSKHASKNQAVQDQLNREKTSFNSTTFGNNSITNGSSINISEKPSMSGANSSTSGDNGGPPTSPP